MSKPDLFIVESLRFEEEKQALFEGKALKSILNFSFKDVIYYYIRTKKELKKILIKFHKSRYRYLHISCHGNDKAMFTTLDEIPFKEIAQIMNPFLRKRRLFFSACSMTNIQLAKYIINISGCYSVLGPKDAVSFDRAAIFWASFYHLMLRDSAKSMKRQKILERANSISTLFGIPLNYYYNSSKSSTIIKEYPVGYSRKR